MATRRPVAVVVESDVLVRSEVAESVRREWGAAVSVLEAAGPSEAHQLLDRLLELGDPVALLVLGRREIDGSGAELVRRVAAGYPAAILVVLARPEDSAVIDGVVGGVAVRIWLAGDRLPAVPVAEAPASGARVIGRRYGWRAYEIKDFLSRNLIPFSWHDVDASAEAAALRRELGLPDPVVTTVVLADGTVLLEPELVELATVLGLTEPAGGGSYDLVIVGGGPAGLAAAVYGACEGLRVVVIEDDAPGGQAGSTSRIENYLGFPTGLTGADLAHRALEQARRFGVRWLVGRIATGLSGAEGGYLVHTDDGNQVRGRAVLVTTGMRWRTLDVPSASRFVNRGVYYGASLAEAAQTAGEDVYVVGAGNSAGQAALYFADHARSVTMLVRGDSLDTAPMSRYLMERIRASDTIRVRTRTVIADASGDERLESLVLQDMRSETTQRVPTGSVYALIGMQPCTEWLPDSVALDDRGFVLTGAATADAGPVPQRPNGRVPMITETSQPGVFAAGDVCSGTVKRVGAAVGQGAMAIQVIAEYLRAVATDRIPRQSTGNPGTVRQFELLDADGNGYLEQSDLRVVAERLVAGFGAPVESAQAQRVVAGYAEFWHALVDSADSDGDGRITRAEFDAALARLATDRAVFTRLAEAVVALCDTDDDGSLNQAEFQQMLGTIGVSIDDVGVLFHSLDADASGYLDVAEIADALCRFYAGAELRNAVMPMAP